MLTESRCIYFFLLAGHKVDFIAPCGAKKSTFWPASRKKIVCNTGKTFILLVWLLTSLCSGIKLHTRKINFFFPSCTMHYSRTKHFLWLFNQKVFVLNFLYCANWICIHEIEKSKVKSRWREYQVPGILKCWNFSM